MTRSADSLPAAAAAGAAAYGKPHIRLLRSLERIDAAIRVAGDLDDMMVAVLDTALDLFDCDRAWLLYPCDAEAPSWSVPMERTRAGWPGALAVGAVIPMLPEAAEVFRAALDAGRPVPFDPESGRPLPAEAARSFTIRSQLVLAVHPRVGKPWLFGVHQCSHARVWTAADQHLFHEIGRRIADALTSLLILRDLRASEEKYREVVEGTDDAVMRLDAALRCTFVNQAGGRILGLTPDGCLGRPFLDFVQPDDRAATREAIEAAVRTRAASVAVEDRVVATSGDVHHMLWTVNLHFVDASGPPADVTAIGHDISQRVRAEQEVRSLEKRLFAAQKMEAVGTLAGGIAHDFNNILGAIIGYADLARTIMDEDAPAHEFMVRLIQAAQRARDLVRQILTFSRRVEHQKAPVDLRSVVQEALVLLRASIPKTIEIHEELPREPALVFGDETRLHQVLMNLCTNAYQAMGEAGGRLDVAVRIQDPCAAGDEKPAELGSGPCVLLTVRDTGGGMDAATLARAFEPFFTTRARGGGTGMGLSVVHGIVESHGGAIRLESEPGRGTTASIYLPRHLAGDVPRKPAPAAAPGGDERILFVDDEAALVDVSRALLAQLGYHVTAVTDPRKALELFRGAPESFDLVVSDQTMPRLTGAELAAEIRRIRPGTPVILCTGFSDTLTGVSPAAMGASAILLKPLDRDTLARAVRKAIDEAAGG